MLEPAHSLIRKCGGFAAVARMTGRSEVRVRRWTYPVDRGGTGGMIPTEVHERLMLAARAEGVDLRPDDFWRREVLDVLPSAAATGDAA